MASKITQKLRLRIPESNSDQAHPWFCGWSKTGQPRFISNRDMSITYPSKAAADHDRLTLFNKHRIGTHLHTDKPRNSILTVILATEPYNMIKAGIKKEEYREIKPYWSDRLIDECTDSSVVYRAYDIIRFRHGYGKAQMDFRFDGVRIGVPNPEWTCGIIAPEKCYIISFSPLK